MGSSNRKRLLSKFTRARRQGTPPLQYGALCYRHDGKGLRILLVTSRRTKRWVSPKGWPMKGKTPREAAAQEAWEEAGVKGVTHPHSIGFYSYRKFINKGRSITCTVQVFPLEVTEQVAAFPEHRKRRTRWMKPGKAAKRVMEPELARLIKRFAEQEAKPAERPDAEAAE